jgi:hypothetical protein
MTTLPIAVTRANRRCKGLGTASAESLPIWPHIVPAGPVVATLCLRSIPTNGLGIG